MKKKYLLPAFFAAFALFFAACGDEPGNTGSTLIHHWLMDGDTNDLVGGKTAVANTSGIPVSGAPDQFVSFTRFEDDDEWGRKVLYVGGKGATDIENQTQWNACWIENFNAAPLSELTVALWIKVTDISGIRTILILEKPTSANGGLFIVNFFDGYIKLGYGVEANIDLDFDGYYNNQWVHLALTFKDNTATLYINGKKAGELGGTVQCDNWWDANGETTSSGTAREIPMRVPRLDSLWIGGQQPSQHFCGYMTDIRMYNKALTVGEINALAGML